MRDKLRLLDLFSGIGGFSLGLERTGGFETVAFCEIDPFCQKVLRKHWPDVRQYQDVTKLTAEQLKSDGITVDAICGGFPCQDISVAGSNAGMGEGTRSGLWSEYARLVGELRPRYVIVENVAALLSRGLDRVLGDLAALGYGSVWHCIPACAVGAPHRRDRVWIIAYTNEKQDREFSSGRGKSQQEQIKAFTYADDKMRQLQSYWSVKDFRRRALHSSQKYWPLSWEQKIGEFSELDDGVSSEMDQIETLVYGNAVVPQIPELIGNAILEAQRTGAHK